MLLDVRDLTTYFTTKSGPVKAVDGVSYQIAQGETVALVGESGCGKSVSALSLLGLLPGQARVMKGEAWFEGADLLKLNPSEMRRVRGRRIAFVFQEPMSSLNPVLTIGRQMTEGLREHGLCDAGAARRRSVELLASVGISDAEQRMRQFPGQFSGGMRQRVMLAIALACSPSLIIADEPTTALDVTVQAQILELLASLSRDLGVAVLLITHNMGVVAKYADRVNVMYAGRIVEQASVEEIFQRPKHQYTRALLSCVPRLDRDRLTKLVPIEGQPPNLVNRPSGCAFHPRCEKASPDCKTEWPTLRRVSEGHTVACGC